jgi:hypothetical protein
MYINLKSTIIYGPPASGKTHFIHQYIQAILKNPLPSQMILIDPKQTELRQFKHSAKTMAYISENIEDHFDQFTLKILQNRFANLKANKSNQHEPKLYLIFDEVRDAFTKDSQRAFNALGKLMRYHQELGIELVMATQREALPPSLTKFADTMIEFSTIVNPLVEEKHSSMLQHYLHFESVGLEGNQTSVDLFLKGYRDALPRDAKIFQVNCMDKTELSQLEHLFKDRINPSSTLSKEPLAYAFIHANGKLTEHLEFYTRLKGLVKKALASRILMILVMEESSKIPHMLKRELHTSIIFSM